jgi:hypothetical protein
MATRFPDTGSPAQSVAAMTSRISTAVIPQAVAAGLTLPHHRDLLVVDGHQPVRTPPHISPGSASLGTQMRLTWTCASRALHLPRRPSPNRLSLPPPRRPRGSS